MNKAYNTTDNELIFEAFMKSKVKPVKEQHVEDGGDKLMDKALDIQYKTISKKFGKRIADNANYGWGQSDGSIATKVYTGSKGIWICNTYYDENGSLDQEFETSLEPYDSE